jgi:hypothetical protein
MFLCCSGPNNARAPIKKNRMQRTRDEVEKEMERKLRFTDE